MVIKITGFPGDTTIFVRSQEKHGAFTAGKMHADGNNKPIQHIIRSKLEIHMEKKKVLFMCLWV